jgi:hypothetical protein
LFNNHWRQCDRSSENKVNEKHLPPCTHLS